MSFSKAKRFPDSIDLKKSITRTRTETVSSSRRVTIAGNRGTCSVSVTNRSRYSLSTSIQKVCDLAEIKLLKNIAIQMCDCTLVYYVTCAESRIDSCNHAEYNKDVFYTCCTEYFFHDWVEFY